MGSDRARVTYDPKQQYRSVVMQQGRVTLEADWNEASQIASEELRKETLDFVGPCGTPDNGYEILLTSTPTTPPYDFSIQSGTMYVGGIRAYLFDNVQYSNQPDWQDIGPEDKDWESLSSLAGSPATIDEFVYLYLREQEVSAVEDPDLKDIALGGPDTAQRTRLLQRIVRVPCQGTDCLSGLIAAEDKWQTEGLYFDSSTMRLESWGRLIVSFQQTQNQGPCQPQAQGGYVDPDNQLIRVQITGNDPVTGSPQFLWGFDDASFLYRISVDPQSPENLVFQSVPVDASHQPMSQQTLEVLRTAAILPNGGEVAATSGFVFTLDKNYIPDKQMVVLPSGVTLPADYTTASTSPPEQLFLRVWESVVSFTPGQAKPLGDTGVSVTLSLQSPGDEFHVGDYWLFAVRPTTPQTAYPERYQNSPQPPEGPRLWACPLGVIAWNNQVGTLVSDCRNKFCNLVDACRRQQGCCTITVRPQDVTGDTSLQDIIYQASSPTMQVQAVTPGSAGNNISVQISNLNLTATPPTFDLTVTETELYLGVTVNGGGVTAISNVIGTDQGGPNGGLAHVLGQVNTALLPLNQQMTFSGGNATTKAQAQLMDSTNAQVLCTLEARGIGVDGNVTQVAISNVSSANPPTFDITLTWQKTVSAVNMATLFPIIQNSFAYEIQAFPPTTVAPAFPAEGVTQLSGGVDVLPSTGTNPVAAQAYIFGNSTTICLRAGSYPLLQPLTFGVEQSNITIEACNGATISVSASAEEGMKQFITGMIHMNGANHVTFDGISFTMPRITVKSFPFGGQTGTALGDPTLINIDLSVAMMVSDCAGLTVEDCEFLFPSAQIDEVMFAAAIFAGADCKDVTLTGNSFLGPAAVNGVASFDTQIPNIALSLGYVQADTLTIEFDKNGVVNGGTLIPSSLDNIVVAGNSFEHLTFPVVIITALGAARFETNIVRSCLTGFTILPLIASLASPNSFGPHDFRTQILNNPTAQRTFSLVSTYPRPASFVPKRMISLVSKVSPIRTKPVVGRVPAPTVIQVAVPPRPAPGPAPAPPAPGPPIPGAPTLNLAPFTAKVAQFSSYIFNKETIGNKETVTVSFRDLDFSVRFSNNDVDAFVLGGGTGWALTIFDIAALLQAIGINVRTNETTFGSVNLTGNKFRNRSTNTLFGYTVSAMCFFCAATGNVILNLGSGGPSLAIVLLKGPFPPLNVANAAVTGNVLKGQPFLPQRSGSPPLPEWETYNDVFF